MPTGCKSCGARAPTLDEVSAAMRNSYVVCRCPNDGTVQEPVACFTDPDAALIFANFEMACLHGTPAVLAWMRDNLAGNIDAEVELGVLDAEQAARAHRAVTAGFDAIDAELRQLALDTLREVH